MNLNDLPTYTCHKTVRAIKIVMIVSRANGSTLYPAAPSPTQSYVETFDVTTDWAAKHDPQPGGYYVVYEDGYTSYSPAEAFEKGYTLVKGGQ